VALVVATACGDGDEGGGSTTTTSDTRDPRQRCLDTAPLGEPSAGLQQTWGAACGDDQECKTLTDDDAAACLQEAVIFELPDGYCSKPCDVGAEPGATVILDAPDCGNVGLACVGVEDRFEVCALPCASDEDCPRAGYLCRTFPLIGLPGDPKFCLMADCCTNNACACEDPNDCHAIEGG